VKVLVLGERFGDEVPVEFEIVGEPEAGVVAVLTVPRFPVRASHMDAMPALRAIGTASVGFDHIDVAAAEERGVAVVSVPDYCTEEVADHTLALLLALVRGVVELDRDVSRGGWSPKAAGPLRTLAELRVGIVGLGRIGSAVARRLLALGVEVLAYDVLPVTLDGVECVASLHELLGECDAVTLHVPLTAETRGLIGRLEIESMRAGALLVNTSRGPVVDDGAVLAALRSGRLGGAALDVLPREPPPAPPLAPNLIVTPHAAYYSPAAEERAVRMCLARVREILGA
jgi:D-3-phosphoglycerate dehydrogenase